MAELQRVGEVIEASTTALTAQCYELYEIPPLGSLVKTGDSSAELYAIVYNAATTSLEPGRRPIARGKDETSEEAIYRSSPQLAKLLRSEFGAVVVGHKEGDRLHHHLPPQPARIHSFVYQCSPRRGHGVRAVLRLSQHIAQRQSARSRRGAGRRLRCAR